MAGRHVNVRPFAAGDADAVSALFSQYMREAYGADNCLTPDVLRRDTGQHFNLLLATDEADIPIAFAAWREAYDLHHAAHGVEVPDLFVKRRFRGRAVAIRLMAALAGMVRAQGGSYIVGEVGQGGPRSRLVERMTVGFFAQTVYLAGRGLRELAALADADLRSLPVQLPRPDASKDP